MKIQRADEVADFATCLGDIDNIFFQSSAKRDFSSQEEKQAFREMSLGRLKNTAVAFLSPLMPLMPGCWPTATRRRSWLERDGGRDARRCTHGKNGRHSVALPDTRMSIDAERLRHDPAMRWIVGGKGVVGRAASPSQIGRFETQWLATDKNLSALADLSGQWIDLVRMAADRPVASCSIWIQA